MGQDIQTSNPNHHPHEIESPWTKVKHNKKAKSNRTDHGHNTVSGNHEATQNLSNVQQNNNTGIRLPSGTRDTMINRNHTKDFRSSHHQIIAINETKLDEYEPDSTINLSGYTCIRKDRNKAGGGVCIYIRNTINFTWKKYFEVKDLEIISIEITKANSSPFLFTT